MNKPSYIFTIQEYNVIFLFNWLVKFIFSFLKNYHIYKPNLSLSFSTQTLTTFTRSVSVALFVFSSFLQAVLKQRPPRFCSLRARRCSLVCWFSASPIPREFHDLKAQNHQNHHPKRWFRSSWSKLTHRATQISTHELPPHDRSLRTNVENDEPLLFLEWYT